MRFERKKDIPLLLWKDASGEKKGGFPTHECSKIGNTIRILQIVQGQNVLWID